MYNELEADCYWCLSKIMDRILDNYTNNQPGVLKAYNKIKDILNRLDKDLLNHILEENVDLYTIIF